MVHCCFIPFQSAVIVAEKFLATAAFVICHGSKLFRKIVFRKNLIVSGKSIPIKGLVVFARRLREKRIGDGAFRRNFQDRIRMPFQRFVIEIESPFVISVFSENIGVQIVDFRKSRYVRITGVELIEQRERGGVVA